MSIKKQKEPPMDGLVCTSPRLQNLRTSHIYDVDKVNLNFSLLITSFKGREDVPLVCPFQ